MTHIIPTLTILAANGIVRSIIVIGSPGRFPFGSVKIVAVTSLIGNLEKHSSKRMNLYHLDKLP